MRDGRLASLEKSFFLLFLQGGIVAASLSPSNLIEDIIQTQEKPSYIPESWFGLLLALWLLVLSFFILAKLGRALIFSAGLAPSPRFQKIFVFVTLRAIHPLTDKLKQERMPFIGFCPHGEIGRHKGLKILARKGVPVRVWLGAPLLLRLFPLLFVRLGRSSVMCYSHTPSSLLRLPRLRTKYFVKVTLASGMPRRYRQNPLRRMWGRTAFGEGINCQLFRAAFEVKARDKSSIYLFWFFSFK